MPLDSVQPPSAESLLFRYAEQQRQITAQLTSISNTLARGVLGARINASEAIPPADQTRGSTDASPGLGTIIDFQA